MSKLTKFLHLLNIVVSAVAIVVVVWLMVKYAAGSLVIMGVTP